MLHDPENFLHVLTSSQKKPYSAVTVTIENLTGERYEEDDLSGIPELVEAIKLQESGPTEAARAIRKKLKYGNAHRQLRALTILDGLIQNAGARFQRTFADEMLLERLRVMGTAETTDIDVRKKCNLLFRNWAVDYKNTPGLERLAKLHKELPQRKQVVTQARSKVIKETENPFGEDDEDDAPPGSQAGPSHSRSGSGSAAPAPLGLPMSGRIESFSYLGSSKDKKKKDKDKKGKSRRSFNLDAERDKMKGTIADASMASTQLLNSLQTINREMERISENQAAVQRFEACKQLRRRILRYVSLSAECLGQMFALTPIPDLQCPGRAVAGQPAPRQRRARPRPHDLRAA